MSAMTDLPFTPAPGMELVDGEPDQLVEEVWDYEAAQGMTAEEQAEQAEIAEEVAKQVALAKAAGVVLVNPETGEIIGGTGEAGVAAAAQAPQPQVMPSHFPAFEGIPVRETTVKLNGEGKVESLAGLVVSIDDRVRLVGEFKVVGVNHKVDAKTGEVIREMVFKASNLELAPWDPADPTDDGVLRARPSH
jgi:hypothetical protein